MGSIDRPGRPDEPDQPERRAQGGESEASRAERLGLEKLSRADYYKSQQAEAVAQGAGRLDSDRKTPRGAPDRLGSQRPEDKPDTNIESFPRNYWTEVPRFLAAWREHLTQWPRSWHRADRSIDPEQRAKAVDAIKKVPDAEPPISSNVQRVEAENSYHGWLKGFEFRLKGQDRLMEKVAEGLETSAPDASPDEIVTQIPDAIRYTFCLEHADYTNGCRDIKGRLEACGYEMYYAKNSWTDPEYKGINTRWVTPEGQRFEVQFHTRESFHAKHQVTHEAYERLRNPMTSGNERRALSSFQREVSKWIPVPAKVTEIKDYKKKGF